LSIDRRIQYLAHRELAKAVELHKAKAGAAIVLDAKTGEVLAMANVPTYNPNNPVNIQGKSRNRAITDIFEPGSTLKPMTAAAGLESGKYIPDTKIQTAPGYMSSAWHLKRGGNHPEVFQCRLGQNRAVIGQAIPLDHVQPDGLWHKNPYRLPW
jgi:cell division protein FtsI/penicillin-binding protein 2